MHDTDAFDPPRAMTAITQERADEKQDEVLRRLPHLTSKLADIPIDTPARPSWHVTRARVMLEAREALCRHNGGRLVGLTGESGSGKTTAASELVRSTEVRKFFADGVVWLSVNDGAKDRLPSLMMQLATRVHEHIWGGVGPRPLGSDDPVTYIKERMAKGRAGHELKCLVVADNVWEAEVMAKLRETRMWVLVTTRNENLVIGVNGENVQIDTLSEDDAVSVLREASELPTGVRLPEAARELIELCGRVAMDLAFVGRWGTVRKRKDTLGWSDAAAAIRTQLEAPQLDAASDEHEDARVKRRTAVLRAGFQFIGTEDGRLQWLYLSLGVLPDAHAFLVREAGVLLYDRQCSTEDEQAVEEVVQTLERWSILRAGDGRYRMHDAHAAFARQNLADRGDVRRPAVRRWVRYISSLDALSSMGCPTLVGLWHAVERVSGTGRLTSHPPRPYDAALAKLDDSDSVRCRNCLDVVGVFRESQQDWEGAHVVWHRLLAIEQKSLGEDHPFVVSTLRSLAECSERMGNGTEALEWRRKERKTLESARASSVVAGNVDADSLVSLATSMMHARSWRYSEIEPLFRRALEIHVDKLGGEDVRVAQTLHSLGVCNRQAGRTEEAAQLFQRSLEIREAKLGPSHVIVANTLHELGMCALEARQYSRAEYLLVRALSIKQAKLGPTDLRFAYTLHELGVCAREAGRNEEALTRMTRSLKIVESKLGTEDPAVAYALHDLGACLRQAGRPEEAEQLLQRALDIREAQLGPKDVQVAYTRHELGVCARIVGKQAEAETLLRIALEIEEATLGPDNVQVAYTLHELGVCAAEKCGDELAENLLHRALKIKEAKLGSDHVQVAYTLQSLGVWLRQAGRLEEAQQYFCRALHIAEAKLGPWSLRAAYTLHELGVCVRTAGRVRESEQLLRRALEIEEASLGKDHIQVLYTLHELGVCLARLARREEAVELLSRALELKKEKLGEGHVQVAYTRQELMRCALGTRRRDEAGRLLRGAWETQGAELEEDTAKAAGKVQELSVLVRMAGQYDKAEKSLRKVLCVKESSLEPDDVEIASTVHQLGICVWQAGRREEAEKLLRQALELRDANSGSGDAEVADVAHDLGMCILQAGRNEEAELLLARALTISEAYLGKDDVVLAYRLHDLGACALRAGRKDEAEKFLTRALEIEDFHLRPDDVQIIITQRHLDRCVVDDTLHKEIS